jgi:hypothetical protein
VGTILQLVPSKCSASVESNTGGAETWSLKPTAQMSLAAIAAVAKSWVHRFGVEMQRRRAQELTRLQWIKRRSYRPPGSAWRPGSRVHRCAPLLGRCAAQRDRSPQFRAAGPSTGCSTLNAGRRDFSQAS